jgi:hypothetical protein
MEEKAMKKPYIQPLSTILLVVPELMQQTSVRYQGTYDEENKTENGGAGILSRGDSNVWDDDEDF